ncbi:hypothetical protein EDB19DRAFT_1647996, partial [Suillus lakei]
LFSVGTKIATDHRSRLGADKFEQFQILKHMWQDSIVDRAASNSSTTQEVSLEEFKELLSLHKDLVEWDQSEDKNCKMVTA